MRIGESMNKKVIILVVLFASLVMIIGYNSFNYIFEVDNSTKSAKVNFNFETEVSEGVDEIHTKKLIYQLENILFDDYIA